MLELAEMIKLPQLRALEYWHKTIYILINKQLKR
jgi:hypothetical protein